MDWLRGILRRDVNTLVGFFIWRIVTIALLILGGVTLFFAAVIGGIFFNVTASTVFTWFAFTLIAILLLSLLTATIIFTTWFMRQNIWLLPVLIVLILMLTIVSYTGQCYVVECPVCGENVCFDDPSEMNNLVCGGQCPDCMTFTTNTGYPCTNKDMCTSGFDVYCTTCGVENSYVADSDFNHLYCNSCDKKYDLECAGCGAENSIIELEDSNYLYCVECDEKFGLECSNSKCQKTTYLTKDTDINDLKCSECNIKFNTKCSNCSKALRNSKIETRYELKPLRCTECHSINSNIRIADEGGFDVIKQFQLGKFVKFIDYKFDKLIGTILSLFK